MRKRLTNRLVDMLNAAFTRLALDKELDWDVVMTPTPDGPIAIVYGFQPGALLGTHVWGQVIVPAPADVTQENMDEVVTTLLEALAQTRSAQLAPVAENGHKQASGLEVVSG